MEEGFERKRVGTLIFEDVRCTDPVTKSREMTCCFGFRRPY